MAHTIDSGSSEFNLRTPRERAYARADAYRMIIDDLSQSVPTDIGKAAPWLDRDFQTMLVATLQRAKKFEEDARKLAVIKEVFSGK